MDVQKEKPLAKPAIDKRSGDLKRYAIGLGYAATIVAGGALLHKGVVDLDDKFAITTDQAQPSGSMSDAFEGFVALGAAGGVGFAAYRGVNHIRNARDRKRQAIENIALEKPPVKIRNRVTVPRFVTSVGLISTATGASLGMFKDMSDAISTSQTDAASALSDVMDLAAPDSDAPTWMLTNTLGPELANNIVISPSAADKILDVADESNLVTIPVRTGWHSAQRSPENDAKLPILTIGLPEALTGLPKASEDCTDVSVNAASALGIGKGETFQIERIENMKFTVRDILPQEAGANLVPVVFNNEDFARCIDTNPDQPFSALLARGEQEEVERVLADAGISSENLSERVFVVPEQTFIDNTLQTGKNNVNPFVLVATAVGLAGLGMAGVNKAGKDLANARNNNIMQRASGWSKKAIAQKHYEQADKESLQSAIASLPLVVAIDYVTNTGTPGAALGPTLTTALFVIGGVAGMNRLTTHRALKREFPKIDNSKGYGL